MENLGMYKDDHTPIYDNLREMNGKLDEITKTLNELYTKTALQNAANNSIDTRLLKIELRVASNTTTLYGDNGQTGLINTINNHTVDLTRIYRLFWVLVGGCISAIGVSVFNILLSRVSQIIKP